MVKNNETLSCFVVFRSLAIRRNSVETMGRFLSQAAKSAKLAEQVPILENDRAMIDVKYWLTSLLASPDIPRHTWENTWFYVLITLIISN